MTLLRLEGVDAHYGDMQALYGVDLDIAEGQTVALIGPNGAGKTTLLKTISGWLAPSAGAILFDGEQIAGLPADVVVKRGIATVPEGRRLFPALSVEENLLMGQNSARKGPWNLDRVYGLFPVLRERRKSPSTALSGGQQQMVAIGRALMTNPRLLLCDELSLGLAPTVVNDIYDMLPGIAAEGVALLIVEQDVARALKASSLALCLMEGRRALAGASDTLSLEEISKAYFGARP
jgi:branched-chain amino acid transport system ATP-binding protein